MLSLIVLEGREKLEYYVALLLELSLDPDELLLEGLATDCLIVHLLEKSAQKPAHVEHILQCLHDLGQVQEALVGYLSQIGVVQVPNLFEILGALNRLDEVRPLALENVHLQVGEEVVN